MPMTKNWPLKIMQFTSCISKINNTLIDNAEDLDVVMHMYNLLEYSNYFSKTTTSFWDYYRDEPNNDIMANNDINYSIKDSKIFDYKTSITGKLEGNNTERKLQIVVPLKHLKFVSAIIFYQIFIFSPNDIPLKTMKNVFYFI